MTPVTEPMSSSAERAADRSPAVARSRTRQIEQAQAIIDAARRLITDRGDRFTTQELVKEAGVALQTFYRLFESKDRLLLAVVGTMIAEYCAQAEVAAAELPDPVARLRFYVISAVESVGSDPNGLGPRFVTAQHWRLHELFPDEIAEATQPFTDMVSRQLEIATADGSLRPNDPERDAWFVTKLVMAVFHHYAFADADADADAEADAEAIGASLWSFCHAALGGDAH
jgi:AcrR family transcriptional regulator